MSFRHISDKCLLQQWNRVRQFLDFWSDDFYIETEDELKNRLESKQDNEMQFEM